MRGLHGCNRQLYGFIVTAYKLLFGHIYLLFFFTGRGEYFQERQTQKQNYGNIRTNEIYIQRVSRVKSPSIAVRTH